MSDYDAPSRDGSGNLIPLADGQFDISGFRFGGDFDPILLDAFDPGEGEWAVQDVDNPFGGNTLFGRDYLRGPTWSFECFTNGYDIDDSLDAVSELGSIWKAEGLKSINGTYQILRYRLGSQTRRVYGRGRKFWAGVDGRSYGGTAPVSLTFKLMSDMYFEDEEREALIPFVPPSTGGLTAPLTAPLTAVGTGAQRGGTISEVGGTIPTPFHLYIKGEISRPWVQGPGWKIQLNMDVAHDQTVHISTYAGALIVEDNFGRNLTGRLAASTRLNEARLKPGPTSITFGGQSISGLASARLTWRPAYPTL